MANNDEFKYRTSAIDQTNKVAPVNYASLLHSALSDSEWAFFLGKTKFKDDVQSKASYSNTDDVAEKVVNGAVATNFVNKPLRTWSTEQNDYYDKYPVSSQIIETGAITAETDLLLHEVYRYLGWDVLDTPTFSTILTDNEIQSFQQDEAIFVDSSISSSMIEVAERYSGSDAVSLLIRHLMATAYNRKYACSIVGLDSELFTLDVPSNCYKLIKSTKLSVPWSKLPVRVAKFTNPEASKAVTSSVAFLMHPFGLCLYEQPASETSSSKFNLYQTISVQHFSVFASTEYLPYDLPSNFKVMTLSNDYSFNDFLDSSTIQITIDDNRTAVFGSYDYGSIIVSDAASTSSYFDMLKLYDNYESIDFYSDGLNTRMTLPLLSDCIDKVDSFSKWFTRDKDSRKIEKSKNISYTNGSTSGELQIVGFNAGNLLFKIDDDKLKSFPETLYNAPLLFVVAKNSVQVSIIGLLESDGQLSNSTYLAKIICIPEQKLSFEPTVNDCLHDIKAAFSDAAFFKNAELHIYPLSFNQTKNIVDCEENFLADITFNIVDFYLGDFAIDDSSSSEVLTDKSILTKTKSFTDLWLLASSNLTSELSSSSSQTVIALKCTYTDTNTLTIDNDEDSQLIQTITVGDSVCCPGISSSATIVSINNKELTIDSDLPSVAIGKQYNCKVLLQMTPAVEFTNYPKTLSSTDIIESSIIDKFVLKEDDYSYTLDYNPLYAYDVNSLIEGDLWLQWAHQDIATDVYKDRISDDASIIKRILYYKKANELATVPSVVDSRISQTEAVYDASEVFNYKTSKILVELDNTDTMSNGYISDVDTVQAVTDFLSNRAPAVQLIVGSNTNIAFNTTNLIYALQRKSIGAVSSVYNDYDGFALYIQLGSSAANETLSKYQRTADSVASTVYSDPSSLARSSYNDNDSLVKESVYLGQHPAILTDTETYSLDSPFIESSLNPLQSLTNIEVDNYKFDIVNYTLMNDKLVSHSNYEFSEALSYDVYSQLKDADSLNVYTAKKTVYAGTEESSKDVDIEKVRPFAAFLTYNSTDGLNDVASVFTGSLYSNNAATSMATQALSDDDKAKLKTLLIEYLSSSSDLDNYSPVIGADEKEQLLSLLLQIIKSHFVAVTNEQYHIYVLIDNNLYLIVDEVVSYNADNDSYVSNLAAVYKLDLAHLRLIDLQSYRRQYELTDVSNKELAALITYVQEVYSNAITISKLNEYNVYTADLTIDPLSISRSSIFYDPGNEVTIQTNVSYACFGSAKLYYHSRFDFAYMLSPIWIISAGNDSGNKAAFEHAANLYRSYLNDPSSVPIKNTFDPDDSNKFEYMYYVVVDTSLSVKLFKNTLNFYGTITKVDSEYAAASDNSDATTYYTLTSNDSNFLLDTFTIGDKLLSMSVDDLKVRNAYTSRSEGLMLSSAVDFEGYVRGLRKVNDAWYYVIKPDQNAEMTLQGLYETDDLSTLPFSALKAVPETTSISKTPLVDNNIKYFRNALIGMGHSNAGARSTIYYDNINLGQYLEKGAYIQAIFAASDYDTAKTSTSFEIDTTSILGLITTNDDLYVATDYAAFTKYSIADQTTTKLTIDAFDSVPADSNAFVNFVRDGYYVIETASSITRTDSAILSLASSIAVDTTYTEFIATQQDQSFFKHTYNNKDYYVIMSEADVANLGGATVDTADILPVDYVSMQSLGPNSMLQADTYMNGIPLVNNIDDSKSIISVSSDSTDNPSEIKLASVGTDLYLKSRVAVMDTQEAIADINEKLVAVTKVSLTNGSEITPEEYDTALIATLSRTYAASAFDTVTVDNVDLAISNGYYWKKIELPETTHNVHSELLAYSTSSQLYQYAMNSYIASMNLLASLFDDSIDTDSATLVETTKADETIKAGPDSVSTAKYVWKTMRSFTLLTYDNFAKKLVVDGSNMTMPLPLVASDDTYVLNPDITSNNINDLTITFTGDTYESYTKSYPTTEARYRLYLELILEYMFADVDTQVAFTDLQPVYVGDVKVDANGSISEVSHVNLSSGAQIIEKATTDNLVFFTSNGIFVLPKEYTYRPEDIKNPTHWFKTTLPSNLYFEYASENLTSSMTFNGQSIPTVASNEILMFFSMNDIQVNEDIVLIAGRLFKQGVVRSQLTSLRSRTGESTDTFADYDFYDATSEKPVLLYSVDGGLSFSVKSFSSSYNDYTPTGIRITNETIAVGLKSSTSSTRDAEVIAYIDLSAAALTTNDLQYATASNIGSTSASAAAAMMSGTTHIRISDKSVLDGNRITAEIALPAVIAESATIKTVGGNYVVCDTEIFNNNVPDNTNIYFVLQTNDSTDVTDPFTIVNRNEVPADVMNKLIDRNLLTYEVSDKKLADLCYLPDSYVSALTEAYYVSEHTANSEGGEFVKNDFDLRQLLEPADHSATMVVTFTQSPNIAENTLSYIPFTISNTSIEQNQTFHSIKLCNIDGTQYVNLEGRFASDGSFDKFVKDSYYIYEKTADEAFTMLKMNYDDLQEYYASRSTGDGKNEDEDNYTLASYDKDNDFLLVPVVDSDTAENLLLTVPQTEFTISQRAGLSTTTNTYEARSNENADTAGTQLTGALTDVQTAAEAGLKVGVPTYIMSTCEDIFNDEFSQTYSGTVKLLDIDDESIEHEVSIELENTDLAKWFNFKDRFKLVIDTDEKTEATVGYSKGCYIYDTLYDCFVTGVHTDPDSFTADTAATYTDAADTDSITSTTYAKLVHFGQTLNTTKVTKTATAAFKVVENDKGESGYHIEPIDQSFGVITGLAFSTVGYGSAKVVSVDGTQAMNYTMYDSSDSTTTKYLPWKIDADAFEDDVCTNLYGGEVSLYTLDGSLVYRSMPRPKYTSYRQLILTEGYEVDKATKVSADGGNPTGITVAGVNRTSNSITLSGCPNNIAKLFEDNTDVRQFYVYSKFLTKQNISLTDAQNKNIEIYSHTLSATETNSYSPNRVYSKTISPVYYKNVWRYFEETSDDTSDTYGVDLGQCTSTISSTYVSSSYKNSFDLPVYMADSNGCYLSLDLQSTDGKQSLTLASMKASNYDETLRIIARSFKQTAGQSALLSNYIQTSDGQPFCTKAKFSSKYLKYLTSSDAELLAGWPQVSVVDTSKLYSSNMTLDQAYVEPVMPEMEISSFYSVYVERNPYNVCLYRYDAEYRILQNLSHDKNDITLDCLALFNGDHKVIGYAKFNPVKMSIDQSASFTCLVLRQLPSKS